jgi:hypothetical protein
MSSPLSIAMVSTAFALGVFWKRPYCEGRNRDSSPSNQTETVNTVSTIFTAARAGDIAKFDSVIASDFYMYDGGVRFNGDAIMAVIKAQHVAGKHYEWNVTEPDVHHQRQYRLDCVR